MAEIAGCRKKSLHKSMVMLRTVLFFGFLLGCTPFIQAQTAWVNVDSLYQPLPTSVHVFFTNKPIDTGYFRAFYFVADLKNKKLGFTSDTSYNRRLTPAKFFEKNSQPLLVVNCTFFSFATNQNLNVVVKDKKLVSYNIHSLPGRGRDTFTYRHPLGSAIGITKQRTADIAWLFTDSSFQYPYARQLAITAIKDSNGRLLWRTLLQQTGMQNKMKKELVYKKWKMQTAVGGGPVLLQNGELKISNNEELKFSGKAIYDKHPRTAMGYTKDNKLIILVVEGRNPGIASGATLIQLAEIMKNLGCWEALNLDGGGSSCLLINGKETIKPSDAGGQRSVPAVFIIKQK